MTFDITQADIDAGRARLDAIAAQLDPEVLQRAGSHPHARTAAEQPWLVAGVSDGMGLHTIVAAIEAGVLRHGLGVYWEPPHFLERNADGSPVSPVHWARVQNAAALESWAAERGASLTVLAADVIMAPRRGLKGELKDEPNPFSEEIRTAFEPVREAAPGEDVVFINSVAFGKWICGREGSEAMSVPTVDFEGRIIEMKTKKYHARGYAETLDTMGRNHLLLLEAIRELGWLGPDATTAFFTWAGGSQNVDVLEGIYGKGALGDAKVIAERDVAAFRLEHGLDLGAHAIIRLPAFLSAALMGIPGGGLFGLVSRAFLEGRGLFEDMPRLAERMLDRMFGPAWIRENPISQVELDTAETLYIEQISALVDEAHQRIADYREQHPETSDEPLDLETSRRLLAGLAPDDYPELLRRFDPTAPPPEPRSSKPAPDPAAPKPVATTAEDGTIAFDVAVDPSDFRPDTSLVQALESLSDILGKRAPEGLTMRAERVELDGAALAATDALRCEVSWANGGEELVVTRTLRDAAGRQVARGISTLARPSNEHRPAADPALLGEAVGPRMPVRMPLYETYDAPSTLHAVLEGPALIGFARENLKVAGLFEDGIPNVWDVRIDGSVAVGNHLLTYARRESDGWIVTVVDDESRPVLQMSLH